MFREECISASRKFGGSTSPIVRASLWGVAIFFVALTTFVITGSNLVNYSRKIPAAGTITPEGGVIEVYSPRAAVIDYLEVTTGSSVAQGDILATVSDEVSLSRGGYRSMQSAHIEDQKRFLRLSSENTSRIFRIKQDEMRDEGERIALQIRRLKDELELKSKQLQFAQYDLDAADKLLKDKLISESDMRSIQSRNLAVALEKLAVQGKLDNAISDASTLRLKIMSSEEEYKNTNNEIHSREIDLTSKQLDVEGKYLIQSPIDGIIAGIYAHPGQRTTAEEPIFQITPISALLVGEMWIPSSSAALLKSGGRVNLMLDPYPYQKYGIHSARIYKIDASATPIDHLPLELRSTGEPLYKVILHLDRQRFGHQQLPIPVGTKFKAEIVLEKRSIAQWILEPLLGFKNRMTIQN